MHACAHTHTHHSHTHTHNIHTQHTHTQHTPHTPSRLHYYGGSRPKDTYTLATRTHSFTYPHTRSRTVLYYQPARPAAGTARPAGWPALSWPAPFFPPELNLAGELPMCKDVPRVALPRRCRAAMEDPRNYSAARNNGVDWLSL